MTWAFVLYCNIFSWFCLVFYILTLRDCSHSTGIILECISIYGSKNLGVWLLAIKMAVIKLIYPCLWRWEYSPPDNKNDWIEFIISSNYTREGYIFYLFPFWLNYLKPRFKNHHKMTSQSNIKDISLILETLAGHLLDKRTVIYIAKIFLSLYFPILVVS